MTIDTEVGFRPAYPHLENLDRVPEVLSSPEVWITASTIAGRMSTATNF